jgi:PAS domain S-box-containing protein
MQVTESERTREQLLAMNEALTLGALRQHELTEAAESLNVQLQKEIAERRLAEALLSCQKQALEMVAKGEPLEPVLDFLARSMESQSQNEFLVALHLLEEDGHHFGHVAAPSLPASYARATRGMDARLQMSPCSAAMVAQTPTAVRDFAAERRWPAFTAEIVSLGLRGCFTTPIVSSDQRILGTFAIYYREPRDPGPSDQRLVEIVTRTASIAIERKQAEKKLRESEGRFRAIAENIPQLAWIADGEGYVDWFNRGWLEYTGTTLQENQGAGWKAVHHPDYLDAVAEKFERHLREGRDWEDTFPLRGKDGNYRWFLSRMNVIRDESGKVIRFFGTNTDITNEREAEERQRLLIGELAHRGGNLLAVIQSIATRSLSGTRPLAEERETLMRRIQALARTQSVLMNEGFGTPVADIIRLEFEAFSNRVIAVGPNVMLNSRTAQTFALLVHELATNATKYGALSLPKKGQIDIHWLIEGAGEEARFKFQWQERDGPPVVPPTRQGFGSLLFEKVAAQDFGVPPKIRFAPEGLSYEIDAPLSVVAAGLTVPPTLLGLADGLIE